MNVLKQYTVKHQYTVLDKEGYIVAKYRTVEDSADLPRDTVFFATGYGLPTLPDIVIKMEGRWERKNPKYSASLAVEFFTVEPPKDKGQIIAYLSSLHCGIGQKIATAIWRKYGNETWDIVEKTPEKLTSISGITEKTITRLRDALADTSMQRAIMMEYRGCPEMTPQKARKIAEKFKAEALNVLEENIYILCEVSGISFLTADKIAKSRANFNPYDEHRILAAVQYMFQKESEKYGHTCIPKNDAVDALSKILDYTKDSAKVALNLSYKRKECIVQGDFCYSRELWQVEYGLASAIMRLVNADPAFNANEADIDKYIDEFEAANTFKLADLQRKAVKTCFGTNLAIVTGGPGTGKSTIIKCIMHVFQKIIGDNCDIMLMAPTGRAAGRMKEATGHSAATIHSSLGIRFDEDGNPIEETVDALDTDVVIVDEVSMIDTFLAKQLLERIGKHTAVVFVGDSDQLPSVGAGNVLAEMIASKLVPYTKLDVIFRQADGNPIIVNSKKINTGDCNLLYTNTFIAKHSESDERTFNYACNMYVKCVEKQGMDNVVLLVPFRAKGKICVDTFNVELQKRLNPDDGKKRKTVIGKKEFRVGDKVIQTKNTNLAKNGDVGYIKAIEKRQAPGSLEWEECIDILFEGLPSVITYHHKDMKGVDLAYAISVHKSQGSQYKTVLFVMTMEHLIMAKRNLLYTGITRAKENVMLIGDGQAFHEAILNNRVDIRYTRLCEVMHEQNNTISSDDAKGA